MNCSRSIQTMAFSPLWKAKRKDARMRKADATETLAAVTVPKMIMATAMAARYRRAPPAMMRPTRNMPPAAFMADGPKRWPSSSYTVVTLLA
ncbi:hypothetical protein AZA_90615 [Nitrospirillum viridazoti Y2]|nr:hypothetical protein AZA_90615 [Nitrospirillum amazonense Y2]